MNNQLRCWQALRVIALAVGALGIYHLGLLPLPAVSQPHPTPIRPPFQCPSQLDALMPLLLRDLPAYANRVSQRAYIASYRAAAQQTPNAVVPGYVLIAGRPDYQPLTLTAGEYRPTAESDLPQVFFTTLERQYFVGQSFELQHYHWLFLAPTASGWQFALMLSSLGTTRANEPPSPPRDSSDGVIAQAVRIWLRDCKAGSIAAPLAPAASPAPEASP